MIVPIVEGQSELETVPNLMRRIIAEKGITGVEIAKPIRIRRNQIIKPTELEKAAKYALLRENVGAIVLLIDADDDCPRDFAPRLITHLESCVPHCSVAVVLAKREFESWFIGGISSLRNVRGIRVDATPPPDPESIRDAKTWIRNQMKGHPKYVEVLDQPALAAKMDLKLVAEKCPSFHKFVRDTIRVARAVASKSN